MINPIKSLHAQKILIHRKVFIKYVHRQNLGYLHNFWAKNFSIESSECSRKAYFEMDTSCNIKPNTQNPFNDHLEAKDLYEDGLDFVNYMEIDITDYILKKLKSIIEKRNDFYIRLKYKSDTEPYVRPVYPLLIEDEFTPRFKLIFTGVSESALPT